VRERSALYHLASTAMGVYEAQHVHKISHRKEPFGSWEWTTQPLVKDHAALVAPPSKSIARPSRSWRRRRMPWSHTHLRHAVTERVPLPSRRDTEGRKREEMYDNTLINGVDLYYIMREFWNGTMDECAKANGVCVDAGNEIRWQPGDFYDVIHNTLRVPIGWESTCTRSSAACHRQPQVAN
jgi:hypothetical protein